MALKLAIAGILLPGAMVGFAQVPSSAPRPTPVYDVATVKLNPSGTGKWDIWDEDTRWRAANISSRELLGWAFSVDENLVVGLPAWAESARFDIVAKASDATPGEIDRLPPKQRLALLQTLLAERFALKAHTETREQSCLELIQPQPPRPAPGLRQAQTGSSAGQAAARAAQRPGTHAIIHREEGIATLIEELSVFLHRPVVDHTGLKGRWDIDLTWLRENAPASAAPDVPADLVTAVREQLGLDLRSTRAPLPVLVIDRWQHPSEN